MGVKTHAELSAGRPLYAVLTTSGGLRNICCTQPDSSLMVDPTDLLVKLEAVMPKNPFDFSIPENPLDLAEDFKKHDPVNHPKHYTSHPSGIECIEVTRHMSFNIGNAVKYLWRADLKDAPVQDLEKAIWYIQDEIKRRKLGGRSEGPRPG